MIEIIHLEDGRIWIKLTEIKEQKNGNFKKEISTTQE
jgi:hypothetical protein